MRLKVRDKIFFSFLLLLIIFIYYYFSIPCPIYYITGIPCLGCGMTRAWLCVCDFNLAGAFKYHWMFWAVPIVYILFVFDIDLYISKKIIKYFYIFVLIGFFLNWFYRIF